MRRLLATSALALSLIGPSALAAQDLSVSAGATLTTRYVSNGIEQTTGAAFQPYIEAEVNGFYAGIWASNVSKVLLGSSTEVDLYFGYRNEVGKLSYDLGYARYLYRGPSVNCCGEVILSMGVAVSEQVNIGARVAYDPKAKIANSSLSLDFAAMDKLTLSAKVGQISKGGQTYYVVGGSYAVTDQLGVDLSWHDSDISKGVAVLSVSYDVSLR